MKTFLRAEQDHQKTINTYLVAIFESPLALITNHMMSCQSSQT